MKYLCLICIEEKKLDALSGGFFAIDLDVQIGLP